MTGGRSNMMLPTTPGRYVRFIAAGGTIVSNHIPSDTDGDVLAVLRQPNIKIEFQRDWWDRVPRWLDMAGNTVQAEIISPTPEQMEDPLATADIDLAGWTPTAPFRRLRGHKPGCRCHPCRALDRTLAG
jgi:hypothetical protein